MILDVLNVIMIKYYFIKKCFSSVIQIITVIPLHPHETAEVL